MVNTCAMATKTPGQLLMEAIRRDDLDEVTSLLQTTNPDEGNFYLSPLSLAILENREDIFRLLLKHGANVNAELAGSGPLKLAVKCGRLEMLSLLVLRGGVLKPEYLTVAIMERRFECAKFILENISDEMRKTMIGNDSFMLKALLMNDLRTVRLLISFGWKYDLDGDEPILIKLTRANAFESTGELLSYGMDANVRGKYGMTPLLWSCDYMVGIVIMQELLHYGAEVNLDDSMDQKTALHYCTQRGKIDKVKLLLSYDANPNTVDRYGVSPIGVACECGYGEITKCLLNAGAKLATNPRQYRLSIQEAIKEYRRSEMKSLQHLARMAIRERLFENRKFKGISQLPLPNRLKKYLSFRETNAQFDDNNNSSSK